MIQNGRAETSGGGGRNEGMTGAADAEQQLPVELDTSVRDPGPVKNSVTSSSQGPAKAKALTFENLTYTIKMRKNVTKMILNNISGAVAPGEVLAIMG
jgi:hypothetical protein